MKVIAALLGRHFWILTYFFLLLGFLLPGDYHGLEWLVPILLGGILFFTGLKVRLGDVASELNSARRIGRISWLVALKLLLYPIIVYFLTRMIAPEWAVGMLIVTAMPGGLSSSAFSDLYGGNVGLTLIMVLLGSLICPLTIPVLIQIFDPSAPVSLDWPQIGDRALMIFLQLSIPFGAAQLVRYTAPALVARYFDRWSFGAIACACLLGFTSVLVSRDSWKGYTIQHGLVPLALTTGAMLLSIGIGLLLRRIIGPRDSTAFAMTCIYMNNGLSVAFAIRFFSGNSHIMLPSILILLPMVGATALYGLWALRMEKGRSL
jgi:bile acid:Na+ symporter, BASS family